MAHNPQKLTHQLDVAVEDATFFFIFLMANEKGFKAVSNHVRSTLEMAISNSFGSYTGLLRYQLGESPV
jgi:hypothetical protein